MGVTLAREWKREDIEMRKAYCDTLIELAGENPNIVVMDADLMGAMGTKPFAAKFPGQCVNCGIQEANMIGVAAGLSALGKVPFAHTFGVFATRRVCDQVFMSAAYARLNVKIVGSDPGITAALNGGTHMPFDDMGIMRGMPSVTVLEPTDATLLRWMMRTIAGEFGVHYMRLLRKNSVKIYEEGSTFEIGRMVRLAEGKDATIIASGFCVAESLKAAEMLKEKGISVRVLDSFTWKPLDEDAVREAAAQTGAIVTAENHSVVHGLGSAVASVLSKTGPVPVEMIGVQDEFGEVGPADYLAERFALTAPHIARAAERAIIRKQASASIAG